MGYGSRFIETTQAKTRGILTPNRERVRGANAVTAGSISADDPSVEPTNVHITMNPTRATDGLNLRGRRHMPETMPRMSVTIPVVRPSEHHSIWIASGCRLYPANRGGMRFPGRRGNRSSVLVDDTFFPEPFPVALYIVELGNAAEGDSFLLPREALSWFSQ